MFGLLRAVAEELSKVGSALVGSCGPDTRFITWARDGHVLGPLSAKQAGKTDEHLGCCPLTLSSMCYSNASETFCRKGRRRQPVSQKLLEVYVKNAHLYINTKKYVGT